MTLDWQTAEWDERSDAAYTRGLDVQVTPDGSRWCWMVRATAEVSEYPEVYNCGFAPTREKARAAAERSVAKAIKSGYCTKETA